MSRAFWTCTAITILSACVSAGFSIAGLLGPSGTDSFAQYAASRSVALLITPLVALFVRSVRASAALAFAMTLTQMFDGFIGIAAHDPAKTYGPFVFAIANLAALIWMLRSAREPEARANT